MKILSDLDLNGNDIKNVSLENIKIKEGVEDNIVKIDAEGNIVDSGVNISEVGSVDLTDYYTKEEVESVIDEAVPTNVSDLNNDTGFITSQDIAGKQDIIQDLDTIRANAQPNIIESISVNNESITPINKNVNITITEPDLSDYVQTSDLASVATSGDYEDLSNAPDLSNYITSSDLATVATTGDYTDLSNTPDLTNYVTEDGVTHAISYALEEADFITSSDLATVATSGDYTDLINTPDLADYVQSTDLASVATSGDYTDLSNTPDLTDYVQTSDLATVATTGSYNDLEDTPDLSSYITEDGIEEAVSYALEEADFVTSGDLASVATSGSYNDLEDTPDLTDYITSNDLAAVATSGDYGDLDNTPDLTDYVQSSDLAPVATSGDFADLDNAPDMNDYVQTSVLSDYVESSQFSTLLSYWKTDALLASKYKINITDSDTPGQYTYTLEMTDYTYISKDDRFIVQFVYNNEVVSSDITITYGTRVVGDGVNTLITITWDNTKYPVSSNDPLTVIIIG